MTTASEITGHLRPGILRALDDESVRAHRKHGPLSMLGDAHTDHSRLAVVTEEVGECARVLNEVTIGVRYSEQASADYDLYQELIQTAAMFAGWAQVVAARYEAETGYAP